MLWGEVTHVNKTLFASPLCLYLDFHCHPLTENDVNIVVGFWLELVVWLLRVVSEPGTTTSGFGSKGGNGGGTGNKSFHFGCKTSFLDFGALTVVFLMDLGLTVVASSLNVVPSVYVFVYLGHNLAVVVMDLFGDLNLTIGGGSRNLTFCLSFPNEDGTDKTKGFDVSGNKICLLWFGVVICVEGLLLLRKLWTTSAELFRSTVTYLRFGSTTDVTIWAAVGLVASVGVRTCLDVAL